jgi:hypothetical protein
MPKNEAVSMDKGDARLWEMFRESYLRVSGVFTCREFPKLFIEGVDHLRV